MKEADINWMKTILKGTLRHKKFKDKENVKGIKQILSFMKVVTK